MNQPPPILNLPIAVNPGTLVASTGCVGCAVGDGANFAAALQQAIFSLLGDKAAVFPAPLSEAELVRLTAGDAAGLSISPLGPLPISEELLPLPRNFLPPDATLAEVATAVPIERTGEPRPTTSLLFDFPQLPAQFEQLPTLVAELPDLANRVNSVEPSAQAVDPSLFAEFSRAAFELDLLSHRAKWTHPLQIPDAGEAIPITAVRRSLIDSAPADSTNTTQFAIPVPWHGLLSSNTEPVPGAGDMSPEADSQTKPIFDRAAALQPPELRFPFSLFPKATGSPAMPIMDEAGDCWYPATDNRELPPLPTFPIDGPIRSDVVANAPNEDRNAAALARSDRGEFVARMTDALQRAHAQMPRSLEIDLHPPTLGKVHIAVMNHDGVLTARIETQTDAVRTLLLDHLQILDRNLAEHGITLERMQVRHVPSSTAGQTTGGLNDQMGQGGGSQSHQHAPMRQHAWGWSADEQQLLPPIAALGIGDLLTIAPGMDRMI